MHRVRANSGGYASALTPNKSWIDLQGMGFGMSAARPTVERSVSTESAIEEPRRTVTLDSARNSVNIGEEPWDGECGAWDNSARFYHRMHPHSRAGSPTRSPIALTPNVKSPSPAASPIYARRNVTLPTSGSNTPPPGATLSATLSPNTHFLQQHLPPTFPYTGSMQSSPDADVSDPLGSQQPPPARGHHGMVLLTPTTQEWRELKEITRREGEPMPEVEEEVPGSDSSDTGSSESVVSPAAKIIMQPPEVRAAEPDTAGDAPSVPPQTSDSPSVKVTESEITSDENEHTGRVHDIVVPDSDSKFDDDVTLAPFPSAGLGRFNSIGRRDSLHLNSRPVDVATRPKTKRELERERLFKMVDEEIAETSPTEANHRHSWGVQGIGNGSGFNFVGSLGALSSPRTEPPDSPPAPSESDGQSRQVEHEPSSEVLDSTDDHVARPDAVSPTVPVRPSPLNAEPLSVSHSAPSTTAPSPALSPANDIDLASPDVIDSSQMMAPLSQDTESERFEAIRNYSRRISSRHTLVPRAPSRRGSHDDGVSPPKTERRRDTHRVSLVAGRVVPSLPFPALTPLTPATPASPTPGSASASSPPPVTPATSVTPPPKGAANLQSFSPFRSPTAAQPSNRGLLPRFDSVRSAASYSSSVGVPSECATPTSETAGGAGGRGIDDYVILKEAGKGAYGLVMRAKVKGANGQPVGDEVIIKYIIKSRILADCWKKHKVLGPIPVEIHVMDQLRHLMYVPPAHPHPWDPSRPQGGWEHPEEVEQLTVESNGNGAVSRAASPGSSRSSTPSFRSTSNPTQRYLKTEMKHAPERGHPNICKLLDFFEDREFYYMVMPRYGAGVDLFDRVESHPAGLDPFEVRSIVGQLTDAVYFLHANGIVHRDIKDENVILDGTGHCQLIDFGSAAHWRPGKKWDTFSGTLHYASPEILRGEMYGGKEQDIWALGAVAYILLVGETPFANLPDEVLEGLKGSGAEEALEARCDGVHADEGKEADGGGRLADAADFVRCCLEPEVQDRPTAAQLLEHRYLAGSRGWVGHRGWVKGK
ncbi:serine/threonine protein kinase [Vanrija albida]|uniref:Serine/threonine protein kinase n=1 Tax=Vanrija albida TaxID=181172 RepID=A0ABR3Q0T0_9TREE